MATETQSGPGAGELPVAPQRNRYDRAELAGAFGDLGTFIPFVIGYITINQINPVGILVSFGLWKILVGLYFKTPVPVQPMKAIGAAAIANPGFYTHGMIMGAGLFTAIFWTLVSLTGAIDWLAKITGKAVMRGIMLGLGFSFMLEGLELMSAVPLLALVGVVLTLLLLNSRRLPAMLALLLLGLSASLLLDPQLLARLGGIGLSPRLPSLAIVQAPPAELMLGALLLGLPQVPLTLGNAILGTVAENNQHFPDRPLKFRSVALDHGLMNFFSSAIGGVPLCHGAGGMAGHIRFGARTGGALVILGVIVLTLGLFFSDSVVLLLGLIPPAVLGVILFFAGLELATTIRDLRPSREGTYVLLVTAGVAVFNVGLGFLAGLLVDHAQRRGWLKL